MNNLSGGDLALTGESCWEHNDDEDKTSTDLGALSLSWFNLNPGLDK